MEKLLSRCAYFFAGIIFLNFSVLIGEQQIEFNFLKDHEGWVGDFSDYPIGAETFYQLAWGWSNLPRADLEVHQKGIFLTGNNHSDDLFMFIKKQIGNLHPHAEYDVFFSVVLQTNIPPEVDAGVGGQPGQSVHFKVGASTEEPKKVIHENDYILSVDKGIQRNNGTNAIRIGNLINPAVDPVSRHFKPKELNSEKAIRAKADSDGKIWLFLGTDSGYEGITLYYITKVSLTLKPVEDK